MYCKKCGQQLPEHATFCGKCGERVSGAQNHFQVQEEKPVRTAANNSKRMRIIIGIGLFVGIVIVGGFFFLHRDSEEIQNVESNSNNTVVQSGVEQQSDETLYNFEEEPSEEAAQNPEEDDRNEDNLTGDIYESLNGDVSVGEIITFGVYEQDNDLTNGAEPLEWIVLDREDGKALLLSRYVIDCKQYNYFYSSRHITWAECDLRNWLNSTFCETAFDEEEQRQILETEVLNPDDKRRGISGGGTTYDKVFLLLLAEADGYFKSDEDRRAKATTYAMDSKLYTDDENYAKWWLRSLAHNSYGAACVYCDGGVHGSGDYVNDTDHGVRPAMWVILDE